MKWMLTPDEFALVWTRETQLDRRPYPLDTLPRANDRTERSGVAPRLRHRYLGRTDPDLSAALMLCARTDTTTVTLYGECTTPTPRRILAFAAVAQQRAGILVALPDAVSVMICPADQLGRELVEIIGSAPPGRHAPMREPQHAVLGPEEPEANSDTETTAAQPDSADLAADHFRRKLREPVDGRGFITVTVEPVNPLSPPTRHRTWLDFSGDGRYLLTTATDLTLTPVGDAELAEHLVRLARV
ncbi:ESX secretion-associated protein EspG [Nocardia sp. SYP-A9097]|uniref:ESX secretion-associated protein EspG n=1 Tax=Nocardia sp. SYP-A9097 TaxID=2663237 RepID=UPI00129B04CF|nr:ESX secretion-associated protein EspG [Nocardia sp. SYP-A9097]MRH87179.1 ESX secretion-associated protein EspG [Nocardia sp. SYP-A9097]